MTVAFLSGPGALGYFCFDEENSFTWMAKTINSLPSLSSYESCPNKLRTTYNAGNGIYQEPLVLKILKSDVSVRSWLRIWIGLTHMDASARVFSDFVVMCSFTETI